MADKENHTNGVADEDKPARFGSYNVHSSAAKVEGKIYKDYLHLDGLLSNVDMMSAVNLKPVHDEHLFIIIHQTYELWFKQIIWEMDSVRRTLNVDVVGERSMLTILQRMNRVALIWKICVEQFAVLETMTPLDFMEFRGFLAPGSGFQSLQFRIIENKLGQKMENRVNQHTIIQSFQDPDSQSQLQVSLTEPSLCDLVIRWLERTPGLEEDGFNFPQRYAAAVRRYLADEEAVLQTEEDPEQRKSAEAEWKKQVETFDVLVNERAYNVERQLNKRRMTYKAFMGALMVSCYSSQERFHLPHQFLTILMDIDSLMTKWRYNHVMLAQRMLGSKTGTGGSSGYLYLRSTISDRYKVFLDLFNISSFIIPRHYIPPLTDHMSSQLSAHETLRLSVSDAK
ncbi:tryptophan 2,3-dioxygenase-like [Paramacrobiotus metropolitanus]|uniref:tryptophan 2,3-dioxygenase-like n=1 Tax=Paramacrobiotus metropolitanus TaxID=2943436 RepID=UPI002445A705|nr:tryptophan 2,3-dioxygenase-like [Paramacrobiotus metropolitanus]